MTSIVRIKRRANIYESGILPSCFVPLDGDIIYYTLVVCLGVQNGTSQYLSSCCTNSMSERTHNNTQLLVSLDFVRDAGVLTLVVPGEA